KGRDDVPRVSDQQDHTALGQGFYEERRPHRAVGFFYDQVPACAEPREARVGALDPDPPQGPYPGLLLGVAEDVILPPPLLLAGAHVVGVAEHVSHVRLVPRSVALEISHHSAEPAAAGPRDAEHPD